MSTNLPQQSQYGQFPVCGQVSCCGGAGHVTSCYPYGVCYTTRLADPAVRHQLQEVAEIHPLLIADCHGQYRASESYFRERISDWSVDTSVEHLPQRQDGSFKPARSRIALE